MKDWMLILFIFSPCLQADRPPSRFMATVQFAVHESSPEIFQRSQKLVIDRFDKTFKTWPEFNGGRYDVRTSGNEVVFSIVTDQDLRSSLPGMLVAWTRGFNGKLYGKGRSSVYRIDLPSNDHTPMVFVDAPEDRDGNVKILSIVARQARLGDILTALKAKVRSFGYFLRMPSDCADGFVIDYDFGDPLGGQLKELGIVIEHLKAAFEMEDQVTPDGLHIFKLRNCPKSQVPKRRPAPELLPSAFIIGSGAESPQPHVMLPFSPLE